MDTAPPAAALTELLRTTDEADVRRRLAELAGEEAALRALLRAVVARNRVRRLVAGDPNHRPAATSAGGVQ